MEKLDLYRNPIDSLQSVFKNMPNLKEIDVSKLNELSKLPKSILDCKSLELLKCDGCSSLCEPPYSICSMGVPAIKTYLRDLEKYGTTNLMRLVCVLGRKMAGKTSIILTIQNRQRKLMERSQDGYDDLGTKVFNILTARIKENFVRIVDFGGHEVYHPTYQLTIRKDCIPVVVVNMKEFEKIAMENTDDLAAKVVCFDWLSHFYLACPTLGAPVLVITHRDHYKEDQEKAERLKQRLLESLQRLKEKHVNEDAALTDHQNFANIRHFNSNADLIPNENVFFVGDTMCAQIEKMEERILQYALSGNTVPTNWAVFMDDVEKKDPTSPFLEFDILQQEYLAKESTELKLDYMHLEGRILWYKDDKSLKNYIFHKVENVTELLRILFDHSGNKWDVRKDEFKPYRLKDSGAVLEKEIFNSFILEFNNRGLVDARLLEYLVTKESQFQLPVAEAVMKRFKLVYGPFKLEADTIYVIPEFANGRSTLKIDKSHNFRARIDIVFKGLKLPAYVYHQMTTEMLQHHLMNSGEAHKSDVVLHRTGGLMRDEQLRKAINHHREADTVSIQFHGAVDDIPQLWDQLIKSVDAVSSSTKKSWEAVRPVFHLFCGHCLIFRINPPRKDTMTLSHLSEFHRKPLTERVKFTEGMRLVSCGQDRNVHEAFTRPCKLNAHLLVTHLIAHA